MAALFAGSFTFLLLAMNRKFNLYDEGIVLTGAKMVLSGAVPHRDFYAIYGPAQFYVLAALFHVIGSSYLVERGYDIAVRAAAVTAVFAALAKRSPRAAAIGAAAVTTIWMWGMPQYGYPSLPVLPLSLLSADFLADPGASRTRQVFAGALVGLAALFRYDLGAAVAVVGGVGLVITGGELVAYLAGAAIVFGVGFGALLLVGAGTAALSDVFGVAADYVATRRLPFPNAEALVHDPSQLAVYLPPLAVLLSALWLVDRRSQIDEADRRFLILLGGLVLALFLKSLVRPTAESMTVTIVPAFALIAFLLGRRPEGVLWRSALSIATALGLFAVSFVAIVTAIMTAKYPGATTLGYIAQHRSSTASATLVSLAAPPVSDSVRCATRILKAETAPQEKIFVAAGRHDKLLSNDISVYFLADRLPGTHWYHFDPGLQTRERIQSAMIADLRKNRVRWVYRDTNYDNAREPNDSALGGGSRTLDQYLLANYRPVVSFNTVSLWLRDDVPSPASEALICAGED